MHLNKALIAVSALAISQANASPIKARDGALEERQTLGGALTQIQIISGAASTLASSSSSAITTLIGTLSGNLPTAGLNVFITAAINANIGVLTSAVTTAASSIQQDLSTASSTISGSDVAALQSTVTNLSTMAKSLAALATDESSSVIGSADSTFQNDIATAVAGLQGAGSAIEAYAQGASVLGAAGATAAAGYVTSAISSQYGILQGVLGSF